MQEAPTAELERPCGNEECNQLARPSRLNGRIPLYCSKPCQRAVGRQRRKEVALQQTHRWCRECDQTKPVDQFTRPLAFYCRECISARSKERYETDKAYANSLRYRYGLTMDEYNHRRWAQGSRCAICRKKTEERLCVDHNHTTNALRDLICTNCNHALGKAQEDPEILRAMADYLERHAQRDPAEVRYAPEPSAPSLQREWASRGAN